MDTPAENPADTDEQLVPDHAEELLRDLIDDAVPTSGYGMVPVVGLGGSAGSIGALQEFFSAIGPDSSLAYVVVIHLSPEHESVLADMLQRRTRMRVAKVEGGEKIEPGHVYVIPPGHSLRTLDGRLELGPLGRRTPRHVAVDVFFRALADTHGAHAAAVILSGADGDGAIGIKRVKERGGLTVAQDPAEALHDSMPRTAIDTGMVDWVLPVREMPARLHAYFRLEQSVRLPAEAAPEQLQLPPDELDEAALRDVLAFLRTRTGRDFSCYKRATILRRLGRRMQVNGVDNLSAYLTCLRTRHGECGALLQDLLITVTNFFRDADCFAALQQHIPALFEGKGPNETVRVWVAACATGEEAYSVAMLLAEHARTLDAPPLIQVFATDLDEQAIQAAREGLYPPTIEADVSEDRIRRFFIRESAGYRVRRELRETVLFAIHDALKDSPFSRLDLVTCRNLLIYLSRDAQRRVLETFSFALQSQALLFLGSSESVDDDSMLFTVLDKKNRIYLQRAARRPSPAGAAGPAIQALAAAPLAARDGPVIAGRAFDSPQTRVRSTQAHPASWSELHLKLVDQLAPPSVLVDQEHQIVHVSPNAGRYLQFAPGEPTRSLLRAVPEALRIELRASLFQAAQTGEEVHVQGVRVLLDGNPEVLALRIRPATDIGVQMFLVVFEPAPQAAQAAEPAAGLDPAARSLDREVERLKVQLRDTVEQYEASTEELKASNEELQAMNEELRSATEELETSREELQSINEELATVNDELKGKVEELGHANSDLYNLMGATAIATVFLDRELRITRYTPTAVQLFNLIASDLGRPLTDLANRLNYAELPGDAQRVLEWLVPVEREVGHGDGDWYLARLLPYRTLDDRIGGVVVSFINITERKQADEARMWLSAVVTASPDGIISFGPDRQILSWNRGAERLCGYSAEEAVGRPLSLLAPGGNPQLDALAERTLEGRQTEHFDTVLVRKDGAAVNVSIAASPIKDAQGRVLGGAAVARDISADRAAAEALRLSEERMRMVVENVRDYAIFSTDLDRRITTWNAGAQRLLGYSEKEALGHLADMIFVPEDRAAGGPDQEASIALAKGQASDERVHQRKDGSRFRGTGAMTLMRNDAGQPVGFVKILQDRSRVADPKGLGPA